MTNSKPRYIKVLLLLVVAIVLFGWWLNVRMITPYSSGLASISTPDPVLAGSAVSTELDRLFATAVKHMQQGEYEQAINLWHRFLLINPDIPEVKVNMGFSLFEMKRYATARDFFISVMEQNAFQANAYYGLAISSEQLGDIEGALGAMRSYIHLSKEQQGQPFVRKAQSAVWEWETQLAALRKQKNTIDDESVSSD